MDLKERLFTDRVAFQWGAFSHVYRTRFDDKWTISVQYLMWQGAEFHILFGSKHEADSVLKKLFESFNKGKKARVRDGHGWSEYIYDFDLPNCISATELLKLAQEYYPEAQLVLTPTTLKLKEFFFGENVRAAIDHHMVTRNPENILESYSFHPYDEKLDALLV